MIGERLERDIWRVLDEMRRGGVRKDFEVWGRGEPPDEGEDVEVVEGYANLARRMKDEEVWS